MTISLFKAEDCREFPQIKEALRQWTAYGEAGIIMRMEFSQNFRTLRNGLGIVAVCGFVELHEGVAELVLFPGPALNYELFSLCRFFKWGVQYLSARYQRVQMMCLDEDKHFRLAEFLNFTMEGVLHKYNVSGQDYCIFSRVR